MIPRKWFLPIASLLIPLLLVLAWSLGSFGYAAHADAQAALRAHRIDYAEQRVLTAMSRGMSSGETYFLLARIKRKQGDLDGLRENLDKAEAAGVSRDRIEGERLLARAQAGFIPQLELELDALLRGSGIEPDEVFEAYVNGCLAAARLEDAENLLGAWKQQSPLSAQANYFDARYLLFYGRTEEAARRLKRALELEPRHYCAAYLLAKVYAARNNPQQALPHFEHALQMTYSACVQIEYAKSLRVLGQLDEARQVLRQVTALSRDVLEKGFQRVGERFEGAPAHLELGQLELAANHAEAARGLLEVAVREDQNDLAARHAYGLALRAVGETAKAARELEAVREARKALREVDHLADLVEADADLVEERVKIGELYMKYGSKLTAVYWLKTALARDPAHGRAHELLAGYYTEKAAKDADFQQLADFHARLASMNSARGTE